MGQHLTFLCFILLLLLRIYSSSPPPFFRFLRFLCPVAAHVFFFSYLISFLFCILCFEIKIEALSWRSGARVSKWGGRGERRGRGGDGVDSDVWPAKRIPGLRMEREGWVGRMSRLWWWWVETTEEELERKKRKRKRTRPDTRPIPVADGWAGAEMRVFPLFNSITTDRPTDQPTNGWTDKASYRVASPRLKS